MLQFLGDSKSWRASKSHNCFKSYGGFAGWVDFSHWWSFIGKGLCLQPVQQACFYSICTTTTKCISQQKEKKPNLCYHIYKTLLHTQYEFSFSRNWPTGPIGPIVVMSVRFHQIVFPFPCDSPRWAKEVPGEQRPLPPWHKYPEKMLRLTIGP